MNKWIIIPKYHIRPASGKILWALYHMTHAIADQDYARNQHGKVRTFTTRSGARGARSRLTHQTV